MENAIEAALKNIYSDLRSILIFEEGDRPDLYDCKTGKSVAAPLGKITGGIGHNFQDNPIDSELRDFLFNRDVLKAMRDARDVVGDEVFFNLDRLRMLAVVSMAFQFGPYGLARFKKLIAAVKANDWVAAEIEILDSKFYREDAPARAKRVSLLFRGINPYHSTITRGQMAIKRFFK